MAWRCSAADPGLTPPKHAAVIGLGIKTHFWPQPPLSWHNIKLNDINTVALTFSCQHIWKEFANYQIARKIKWCSFLLSNVTAPATQHDDCWKVCRQLKINWASDLTLTFAVCLSCTWRWPHSAKHPARAPWHQSHLKISDYGPRRNFSEYKSTFVPVSSIFQVF